MFISVTLFEIIVQIQLDAGLNFYNARKKKYVY
jgi:hypothetical protein